MGLPHRARGSDGGFTGGPWGAVPTPVPGLALLPPALETAAPQNRGTHPGCLLPSPAARLGKNFITKKNREENLRDHVHSQGASFLFLSGLSAPGKL